MTREKDECKAISRKGKRVGGGWWSWAVSTSCSNNGFPLATVNKGVKCCILDTDREGEEIGERGVGGERWEYEKRRER